MTGKTANHGDFPLAWSLQASLLLGAEKLLKEGVNGKSKQFHRTERRFGPSQGWA
jgi:hypothetical protein